MNKSIKMSLLLASMGFAGTVWAAATAHTGATDTLAASTSGTSSHTISHANLAETVTVKLSKNVLGAYDVSLGGGLAGIATGHPNGKGFIYPNGTSTDPARISPVSVGLPAASTVTTAAAQTAATNAAS